MKITGVQVVHFETFVDRISFGQLMTDYRVVQTVTKVRTDEGAEGYHFGGHFHGDQHGLLPGDQALIGQFLSSLLSGQDPSNLMSWRTARPSARRSIASLMSSNLIVDDTSDSTGSRPDCHSSTNRGMSRLGTAEPR